ncbi:MAG: strictosidine synthase [Burkholderiaceae bacterium]|nr:strictosidine synthase [Burkholderiaceae bacterium]
MLATLRNFTDRLLGRGHAAITVPTMDGTLKPNRLLDQAEVAAEVPGLDDLAASGGVLYASAGPALYRWHGGALAECRRFETPITALAVSTLGRVAVALGGRRLLVLDGIAGGGGGGHGGGSNGDVGGGTDAGTGHESASLQAVGRDPLVGVNALSWLGETALAFTDGSTRHGPDEWQRDLMTLGRTGRAGRWEIGEIGSRDASHRAEWLASKLAWAAGIHAAPGAQGAEPAYWVAESWRHRVLRVQGGRTSVVLRELPGYPGRVVPASAGGVWVAVFTGRTLLAEFVLREKAFRERMVVEMAPEHWIAPALSSGHTFLEPLQGASVKNMGVLKPWAPPRSYGLVIHVAEDGRVLRSLHSQVDGKHHGITAMVEHDGALWCASRGSGRLLRVPLATALQGDAR